LMQVMRSTEDAGWVFCRRLNLMSIYVEFHTYMIHCFNLLENFRTYTIFEPWGDCVMHMEWNLVGLQLEV
jgi:hypothetical protein